MKIPINKNTRCENIEGLINYEQAVVREIFTRSAIVEVPDFEEVMELTRKDYCGMMCFLRYECALAERYLPKPYKRSD